MYFLGLPNKDERCFEFFYRFKQNNNTQRKLLKTYYYNN